jgi:flagellar assembly protein FliH
VVVEMSLSKRKDTVSEEDLAQYKRWEVPKFPTDKLNASALSNDKPLVTAAEIESVQQQAYDEGFAKGHQDGAEKGFNDARTVIEARLAQLDKILSYLAEPLEALDESVVLQTAELAMIVAQHLVQREMKQDPAQVIGVVREALKALPVSARDVKIYLHPDDTTLVKDAFSVKEDEESNLSWKIIEDPLLSTGGCKLISENSSIDATIEKRIKRIITVVLGGERANDD